jgi:hypothetical protein
MLMFLGKRLTELGHSGCSGDRVDVDLEWGTAPTRSVKPVSFVGCPPNGDAYETNEELAEHGARYQGVRGGVDGDGRRRAVARVELG